MASRSPEQRRASIVSPQQSHITLPPLQGFVQPSSDQMRPPAQISNQGPGQAPELQQINSDVQETSSLAATDLQLKQQISNTSHDGQPLSPAIKQEAVRTPQPSSPTEARRPSDLDQQSIKAVTSLKNEHGLRTQSPLRESSIPVATTEMAAAEPQPANPKKRSAPSKTKKGTATTMKKEKAPPTKKRKVEPKRSTTPSSRPSKMPPAKGHSAKGTPMNSSPAPSTRSHSDEPDDEMYDEDDDEEMDGGGDGDLYCVCRKPDTGTFMIGCDGTCDDWFHGKCVGIEERNKNLIDKYICPNCEKKGNVGRTTWKRMCRRKGCRHPARLGKSKSGNTSKYCSDECGVILFRELAGRARGQEEAIKNRTSRQKGSALGTSKPAPEDDIGARGGALSAGEVKALLNVSQTVQDFWKLGDGVLSPPATPNGKDKGKTSDFTDLEAQALQRIQTEKEEARRRHALLKDRMKFVTLVKQAASRAATEKDLKPKEYCGYDPRMEWPEDRFQAWRNSKAGQQAFELETLRMEKSSEKDAEIEYQGEDLDICERKRCARHHDWSKLAVDDLRFEMSDNSDRMRALDREEKDIKERAALRVSTGNVDEGSVEVHGLGISAVPMNQGDRVQVAEESLPNGQPAEGA